MGPGVNVYYNENDAFAAAWLRQLIADGQLPAGHVDERDIRDVQPADLAGFEQCHFFAGIGGWAYALQLAGWPPDRPVWTGSCPCQPFSSAGKGGGFEDPRHLWPTWFRLIRECRPPMVFGEQVASADGLAWLDHVSTDLEAEDYAFGAADLCAAGVGAPHIRQRVYFVAHAERGAIRGGGPRGHGLAEGEGGAEAREQRLRADSRPVRAGDVADSAGHGLSRRVAEADGRPQAIPQRLRDSLSLADPWGIGRQGHEWGPGAGEESQPASGGQVLWLPCRDGKARPTQPGLFPLAHGVPNRVGTLRGAGNAIVPQVAAEFIAACREVMA
jgi:DNA (cytosine-5)-methyltransferase 1